MHSYVIQFPCNLHTEVLTGPTFQDSNALTEDTYQCKPQIIIVGSSYELIKK